MELLQVGHEVRSCARPEVQHQQPSTQPSSPTTPQQIQNVHFVGVTIVDSSIGSLGTKLCELHQIVTPSLDEDSQHGPSEESLSEQPRLHSCL